MTFPENILNSRLNITMIVLLISTQKAGMSGMRRGDYGGGGWSGWWWEDLFQGKIIMK